MNMQQKMAQHIGQLIKINAETYDSSEDILQAVSAENFIRMQNVNYVSQAANQIQMLQAEVPVTAPDIYLRTTFEEGLIEAKYMSKGSDFVELARKLTVTEPLTVVMMPMAKVVGIQFQ